MPAQTKGTTISSMNEGDNLVIANQDPGPPRKPTSAGGINPFVPITETSSISPPHPRADRFKIPGESKRLCIDVAEVDKDVKVCFEKYGEGMERWWLKNGKRDEWSVENRVLRMPVDEE
jgi:hypothetical protein